MRSFATRDQGRKLLHYKRIRRLSSTWLLFEIVKKKNMVDGAEEFDYYAQVGVAFSLFKKNISLEYPKNLLLWDLWYLYLKLSLYIERIMDDN